MSPVILLLAIGGGLILLLLIIGIVVTATSEQSMVEERLGKYIDQETAKEVRQGQKASPIGDWLDVRLEKSTLGGGISRELARADIKLKPGEYIATMIIAGIAVAALSWYFGGRSVFFGIMGGVFGVMLPRMYVKRQQSQRLVNFNNQLADMLNLIVNGLRAGFSTMQAMEAVSREMPLPISMEFRRVVQEMQLGISMEAALDNLLRRIPSDDLELIVSAMNVQREVGGNLAEILDTISHTIRERVRIKGEVRVLTSQVIYSGRFLALMPLLIFLILWFINRPYMMQFFNPETRLFGVIMLIIGGVMITSGYFVMMRIASIEV
ncbi:MAG: type II secretion system F family protein [Anaerolineales bacterium]|nr:type II secretion system F family protein [Anaerolineales bacterium]